MKESKIEEIPPKSKENKGFEEFGQSNETFKKKSKLRNSLLGRCHSSEELKNGLLILMDQLVILVVHCIQFFFFFLSINIQVIHFVFFFSFKICFHS